MQFIYDRIQKSGVRNQNSEVKKLREQSDNTISETF